MGCSGAREKIEDKMMLLKLERMEIQMEKEKELNKLSEIAGHKIKPGQIPDYIDPKFAKEKNIYEDDDGFYNNDKKTDFNSNNKNKKGKGKGKEKKERSKKKNKNDKKENKVGKDKKNKKKK